MELTIVNPLTDDLWTTLIQEQNSTIFHSPAWIRAITKTYSWEPQAYILLDNGKAVAGFPLCVIDDIRGKRAACFPFSDACDPLVSTQEQWNILQNALCDLGVPVVVRCLHNNIPVEAAVGEVGNQAGWHGMDLDRPLDEIWSSLHQSSRRAVRKAQKSGVIVEIDNSPEAMRTYFVMHLQIRKYKYRLLAQPYALFENILSELIEQNRGFILTAKLDGEIIAANIYLIWKDTLTYKFSASHPDYMNYRPTDALIWYAIEYALDNNLKFLDFGLSDLDQDGLIRFKQKYATEEKVISFLRYEPSTPYQSQAQKQAQSMFPKLTELFTEADVPDAVTEEAGELLYRFFG